MSYPARLRKVGGSVMVAIPPAVLDELGLQSDADVDLSVKKGQLVINPKGRPRYTLDQLIKEGRKAKNLKFKDRAWLNRPRVGREII
jgi:antitoxin ChpS